MVPAEQMLHAAMTEALSPECLVSLTTRPQSPTGLDRDQVCGLTARPQSLTGLTGTRCAASPPGPRV